MIFLKRELEGRNKIDKFLANTKIVYYPKIFPDKITKGRRKIN